MAEAGRRPRPGDSGTPPGPCIRMDTAAPSRQQLERDQCAASPQGGEPQGPGKWGFGGFQPLQAQMSPWKVTGTVPAGVPSDTQHLPTAPPPTAPPPNGPRGETGRTLGSEPPGRSRFLPAPPRVPSQTSPWRPGKGRAGGAVGGLPRTLPTKGFHRRDIIGKQTHSS